MKFSGYRLTSFTIFCFFFLLPITIDQYLLGFIDLPSVWLIVGITYSALLGIFGKDYLKFLITIPMLSCCKPTAPNERFVKIARLSRKYVIASGVLTTTIGVIQMLQTLDDPSKLSSSLAISILPIFYAILISEVICAYVQHSFEPTDDTSEESESVLGSFVLPVAILGLTLFLLCVLMLAFVNVT